MHCPSTAPCSYTCKYMYVTPYIVASCLGLQSAQRITVPAFVHGLIKNIPQLASKPWWVCIMDVNAVVVETVHSICKYPPQVVVVVVVCLPFTFSTLPGLAPLRLHPRSPPHIPTYSIHVHVPDSCCPQSWGAETCVPGEHGCSHHH